MLSLPDGLQFVLAFIDAWCCASALLYAPHVLKGTHAHLCACPLGSHLAHSGCIPIFGQEIKPCAELHVRGQEQRMLGRSPEEVAKFLAKNSGLNKTMIGEYLGEREDMCIKVMHAYVDALDFASIPFDTAVR